MPSVGARLKISGMVQGVGFRYYCFQRAMSLGLVGWVRNEPDRTVLAVVEGDRGLIESLIDGLKLGPPASSVADVAVNWLEFTGNFRTFEITR